MSDNHYSRDKIDSSTFCRVSYEYADQLNQLIMKVQGIRKLDSTVKNPWLNSCEI